MKKATKAAAAGRGGNQIGIELGLGDQARKAAAGLLSKALADSFAVYLKTHNYHWNVSGPNFSQLHTLFEGQYDEMHGAVDEIAERIRALGHGAPGSFAEFLKLTTVKEAQAGLSGEDMVRDLLDTQQALIRSLRKTETELGELGDVASADLMVARIAASEKHAWMLRATAS